MNHIKIDESVKNEILPGVRVQFVHSQNMTVAYWTFEAEVDFPQHSHPHEQIVNVIAGKFELIVGKETKRLGPGDVVIIAPDAVHSGRSITACRMIDIFYPIREDYRKTS